MGASHAYVSRDDRSLLPKALRGSQAPEGRAEPLPGSGTQLFAAPGALGVSAKPWERSIFNCRSFQPLPPPAPTLPFGSGLGLVSLRLTSGAETERLGSGQVSAWPGAGSARVTQGSGPPAVGRLRCLPPVVQGHWGGKMGKGLGHFRSHGERSDSEARCRRLRTH